MSVSYHKTPVYRQKANLVDLGLYALSHGDVQTVMAITRLIKNWGMCHV